MGQSEGVRLAGRFRKEPPRARHDSQTTATAAISEASWRNKAPVAKSQARVQRFVIPRVCIVFFFVVHGRRVTTAKCARWQCASSELTTLTEFPPRCPQMERELRSSALSGRLRNKPRPDYSGLDTTPTARRSLRKSRPRYAPPPSHGAPWLSGRARSEGVAKRRSARRSLRSSETEEYRADGDSERDYDDENEDESVGSPVCLRGSLAAVPLTAAAAHAARHAAVGATVAGGAAHGLSQERVCVAVVAVACAFFSDANIAASFCHAGLSHGRHGPAEQPA